MTNEVSFFWRSVFPFLFTTLVCSLILYYGIRKRKKFKTRGERYVEGIIPTHENFYLSGRQLFSWFALSFICYLILVWAVVSFFVNPESWLKNPFKSILSVLLFPIILIFCWYTSWVFEDAKKRNMDIKRYRFIQPLISHLWRRNNYPIVLKEQTSAKSFGNSFLLGLIIWVFLAIVVLLLVIKNLDKLKIYN